MFNFTQFPQHITDPSKTLGIEATRPDTIQRCGLGNIDEQHRPGGDGRAAIEVALAYPLPADGTCLVTDRPDLDSVGAMAVLSLRLLGVELPPAALERIARVAAADSFHAPAEWAPSPLPTAEQPWPSGPAAVSEVRALAAAHICATAYQPGYSVALIAAWILGGEPGTYAAYLACHGHPVVPYDALRANAMLELVPFTHDDWLELAEEWKQIAAIVRQINPGISREMVADDFHEAREGAKRTRKCLAAAARDALTVRDGVAYVTSELPGAIGLGYCVARAVVARNPLFRWPGGAAAPVTEKVTIAFYRSPGPEQLQPLVDALNAAEGLAPGEGGGWGGNLRSGIIGSPQGRAPRATAEQIEAAVRAVVSRHTP